MINAIHIYTNKAHTFYGVLWTTDDTESNYVASFTKKAFCPYCTLYKKLNSGVENEIEFMRRIT